MRIDSVSHPTTPEDYRKFYDVLMSFTASKAVHGLEGKKMRHKLRKKVKDEKFTDLDLAWDSIHAPPAPAPEPAPAPAPSKGKDPAV